MREILPVKGDDPLVSVDDETYDIISKAARKASRPDDVYEAARIAILADREAREKRERHARGDYSAELNRALVTLDLLSDETDGEAYRLTAELTSVVNQARQRGFDSGTVSEMLDLADELDAKLEAMTSLSAQVRELLTILRGGVLWVRTSRP